MKKINSIFRLSLGTVLLLFISLTVFSQFTPVVINGFNHDVIAETGTSSLTTTTVSLDGFTVSNKVMYTNTFRTNNGFGGGGIPDDGTIADASGTYQLANYATNNALLIQRNQTGDILINTPSQFNTIRLLCLSTEGTSLINATLFFSDGTSSTGLTNYSLGDWFNTTTNVVLSGFGRCTRATPASGDDAYPDNPRLFYVEIPIACADRQKNLERINLANVTTAGSNAPYPNAVFFAVSATSYSLNITDAITDETCTTAGAVTLGISGSSAAYNVTWNTTPVQNGLTASNLAHGTYTATITDLNGCSSTHDVVIGQINDLTLTAHIDTTICYGDSFNANTISAATGYSWSPTTGVSDPNIANPVLSPTIPNTLYTVTGTSGTCSTSGSFTVSVNAEISLVIPAGSNICTGSSLTPNLTSNASSITWSPATGVSDPGILNPVLSPTQTTNYTITATTGSCSVSGGLALSVIPPVSVHAGDDVTVTAGQSVQLQGSGDVGTYTWTPSIGLNNASVLNPVASPLETTTYTLTITKQGCSASDNVEIEIVSECGKPMNAITPNGDGINDKWLVTYGNCTSLAHVRVFNRYGSPVFESSNYQNNWEGTYKGKALPDGTYYFVIEYKVNNRTVRLKGDLTILR